MNPILKGFLTVLVFIVLALGTLLGLNFAAGTPIPTPWLALIGGVVCLGYGLQTGILESYDLGKAKGWGALIVDATWSLPNSLAGFLVGNPIYCWFGDLSKRDSKGENWIVYKSGRTTGFGGKVYQVIGTVNIGGPGAHERVHVTQARIFGPLFIPVVLANYVVNFIVQGLWTITIGGILKLCKVRDTAYFRPSSSSVVSGFFGWIYRYTLMEVWAYATESHGHS